jgi:hypothetical protein
MSLDAENCDGIPSGGAMRNLAKGGRRGLQLHNSQKKPASAVSIAHFDLLLLFNLLLAC